MSHERATKKKGKDSDGSVRYHVGIQVELLVDSQRLNGSVGGGGSSSTSLKALFTSSGPETPKKEENGGPARGPTESRKPTYGLWLISNGKPLRLEKEQEQPVISFNTNRPRWELAASVRLRSEKHRGLDVVVKEAKNENAFYQLRRRHTDGRGQDSDSGSSENESEAALWEVVAHTGILLDAFLRSSETVYQSSHTSHNGVQLDITLTRLTKQTKLMKAAKLNTVALALHTSQLETKAFGLNDGGSPRQPSSNKLLQMGEMPSSRALESEIVWAPSLNYVIALQDAWVRLIEFKDKLGEMYTHRLVKLEPDLRAPCKPFDLSKVGQEFFEMMDKAVTTLDSKGALSLEAIDMIKSIGRKNGFSTLPNSYYRSSYTAWADVVRHALPIYNQSLQMKETHDAFKKFYAHIVNLQQAASKDLGLETLHTDLVTKCWKEILAAFDRRMVGENFYHLLLSRYPQLLSTFGSTDMDRQVSHFVDMVELIVEQCGGTFIKDSHSSKSSPLKQHFAGSKNLEALRTSSRVKNLGSAIDESAFRHAARAIKPEFYTKVGEVLIETLKGMSKRWDEEVENAWALVYSRVATSMARPAVEFEKLWKEVVEYQELLKTELGKSDDEIKNRLNQIRNEIMATGTYHQTFEEISYGAKVAWRNSAKCIGRINWKNMIVRDMRHLSTPEQLFVSILEHLEIATNAGKVTSTMTVFAAKHPSSEMGIRMWNSQLIRYAGYRQPDGSILGDPANEELTKEIMALGWEGGTPRTAFDILPIVIQFPGRPPHLFQIPKMFILEVPLVHPQYEWFAELGLKWYAVPVISDFRLEVGGISYTACPFNGWYMNTEIGRNLAERYDVLPQIAEKMGLDNKVNTSLWQDKALLELNVAILHSYQKAGVTMVDHHTASKQFLMHDKREKEAGRECPALWSWIVPPLSSSLCPVWHHQMRYFEAKPNYFYQPAAWDYYAIDRKRLEEACGGGGSNASDEQEQLSREITILFGSETGNSENYAHILARKLMSDFIVEVTALDSYDTKKLTSRRPNCIVIITSTFGQGDPPTNAIHFNNWLGLDHDSTALEGVSYGVFAFGSHVYENFCAFGQYCDKRLFECGAQRLIQCGLGDELTGHDEPFQEWVRILRLALAKQFDFQPQLIEQSVDDSPPSHLKIQWIDPPVSDDAGAETEDEKERGEWREVKVLGNRELHSPVSERSARHIELDIKDAYTGAELKYECGDHIAIMPHNDAKIVEALATRLNVGLDSWFTFSQSSGSVPFATPSSVRRALTQELDLTVRGTQLVELFKTLQANATEKRERRCLRKIYSTLQSRETQAAMEATIREEYMNVLDILNKFTSVQLSFERLCELLNRQRVRLYSISSSPNAHKDRLSITVALVQERMANKKVYQGVCSSYLRALRPGDRVRLYVRKSTFHMPPSVNNNLIMVGAGTGVAPLRAFIHERRYQLEQLHSTAAPIGGGDSKPGDQDTDDNSEALLFFGCRQRDVDFLYREELLKAERDGVLSELALAFSREKASKVYVQHLIDKDGNYIWNLLRDPDTYFYVCGDLGMGNDVYATLINIAKREGGLDEDEAQAFLRDMKKEGRYITDLWGIVLNVNESKEKLKAELADRAKRWMQRMERRKKQESEDSHPKEYMIIKSTGSRNALSRESSSSSVGSTSSRKVISPRDGISDSSDGSLNSKLSNSAIEEKGKHDKIKVKKESEGSNTIVSRFLNLTKRSRKTDSQRAIQQRKAERKAKKQQAQA